MEWNLGSLPQTSLVVAPGEVLFKLRIWPCKYISWQFHRVPFARPHQFSMPQSTPAPKARYKCLSVSSASSASMWMMWRSPKQPGFKGPAFQGPSTPALPNQSSGHTWESFLTGTPGLAMIKGPQVTGKCLSKGQTKKSGCQGHQSKL